MSKPVHLYIRGDNVVCGRPRWVAKNVANYMPFVTCPDCLRAVKRMKP